MARKEVDIQREICDWLHGQMYADENLFFWRSNNIPVFAQSNDGKKRFRALPKHTPKGLPDIIVIYKGHFIALEVKRDSKTHLSKDQQQVMHNIRDAGGSYFRVWSKLQVVCYLEEFGFKEYKHDNPQRELPSS